MPEPRVVIVVPWRAGDRDRERAWAWCQTWWQQFGWPIEVVEHPPPQPFNRAWCINEGARRTWPFDVIVAIDADVFAEDPEQVRAGVARAMETGRLIVPHHFGVDLNQRGTRTLIAGSEGWQNLIGSRRDPCTSRITIVRADLFERVGGFDERFRGWGHEDVAFWAAAVPINGVEQLEGTTYHLWHKPSLLVAQRTRQWKEGGQLLNRYLAAFRNGNIALERILTERRPNQRFDVAPQVESDPDVPPEVDVIVLTAGRYTYLERTLSSFEERVTAKVVHRTIQDDSGDLKFGRWLRNKFPEWEIVTTRGRIGFTEAIRAIWRHEQKRQDGSPFLFHLEEDFVFDRDVDLRELISVLEYDQQLAQVALLREPWAPPEKKAGGIIEQHPEAYELLYAGELPYLKHDRYFTTNPSVYRREIIARGWPKVRSSEVAFTRSMVRKGYLFAYFGDGTPWITHIGDERVGIGY